MPWGANMQRQMERFGASAREIDAVRSSWDRLQARLSAGGISGKLRTNEIAAWRNATIGHFTAVRASAASTDAQIAKLNRSLSGTVRNALLMSGAGYGGFNLGRSGIEAGATYEDLKLRLDNVGWAKDVQDKIIAEANRLAPRFGQSRATMLETLIEGAISSDKPLDVLKKSDTLGRSIVMESLYGGTGRAVEGVRNLDKARDNLGIEDPAKVRQFYDNYFRAKSVLGADLNPDQYRQAIQYARTAGKVVDMKFLATTLPSIIAETKGGDAGTQLRAAFDQFIVGRASKQAKAMQAEYGLRDKRGRLVGEEKFSNPIAWVNDVVAKKLEKRGQLKRDETGRVAGDGKVVLARVLGQLTNNRLSSDFLYRLIDQAELYERQGRQMRESRGGLDSADKVLQESPSMSWQSLQSSLQNAASSITEPLWSTILPGLNGLSGGINSLATSLQSMDPGNLAKLSAIGVGLFGLSKFIGPLLLAKKALDLNTAPKVPPGAGAPGSRGILSVLGRFTGRATSLVRGAVGGPVGIASMIYGLSELIGYGPSSWMDVLRQRAANIPGEEEGQRDRRSAAIAELEKKIEANNGGPEIITRRLQERREMLERQNRNRFVDPSAKPKPTYDLPEMQVPMQAPLPPRRPDLTGLDSVKAKAEEAQAKLNGLSQTVRPGVDNSALLETNALLDAALRKMGQIQNAAAGIGARVSNEVGKALRSAQADYGVTP